MRCFGYFLVLAAIVLSVLCDWSFVVTESAVLGWFFTILFFLVADALIFVAMWCVFDLARTIIK